MYVTEQDELLDYAVVKAALERGEMTKATVECFQFVRSKREARRFVYLRQEQRAGRIADLAIQVRKPLLVKRPDGLMEKIGVYVVDFTYSLPVGEAASSGDLFSGPAPPPMREVWEDSKGYQEDLYLWKRKHVEAQYGIKILET